MWSDVFNVALSNGIFACLFVSLLVYVLKDSRKRESKYQHIIDTLSTKLNTVDEIKQDVTEIKNCLITTTTSTFKGRKKNEKVS